MIFTSDADVEDAMANARALIRKNFYVSHLYSTDISGGHKPDAAGYIALNPLLIKAWLEPRHKCPNWLANLAQGHYYYNEAGIDPNKGQKRVEGILIKRLALAIVRRWGWDGYYQLYIPF